MLLEIPSFEDINEKADQIGAFKSYCYQADISCYIEFKSNDKIYAIKKFSVREDSQSKSLEKMNEIKTDKVVKFNGDFDESKNFYSIEKKSISIKKGEADKHLLLDLQDSGFVLEYGQSLMFEEGRENHINLVVDMDFLEKEQNKDLFEILKRHPKYIEEYKVNINIRQKVPVPKNKFNMSGFSYETLTSFTHEELKRELQ